MTIEPLPPSSDLLEFVDDQRIEGGQGDNWQEPLVGMIRLKAAVTIIMLINNHLVSGMRRSSSPEQYFTCDEVGSKKQGSHDITPLLLPPQALPAQVALHTRTLHHLQVNQDNKICEKVDLVLEAEGDVEEDASDEAEGDVDRGVLEGVHPLEVSRLVDRYVPGQRKFVSGKNLRL